MDNINLSVLNYPLYTMDRERKFEEIFAIIYDILRWMDTGKSWTMNFELVFSSTLDELIITVREEKFSFDIVFSESFGDSKTPKLWATNSRINH